MTYLSRKQNAGQFFLHAAVGGLVLKNPEYALRADQSPDLYNVLIEGRELRKRQGQKKLADGMGDIRAAFSYHGKGILHEGGNIYEFDPDPGSFSLLYQGAGEEKGSFFILGEMLYYINGTVYLCYDGNEMKPVIPSVPLVKINGKKDGSGDFVNGFNRIGRGFKMLLSGESGVRDYALGVSPLGSEPVTAKVGEAVYTEGKGITVDRAAGKIVFSSAQPQGINNIEVTASRAKASGAEEFLRCRLAIAYGGDNEVRVVFSGNPDRKNRIYVSGLSDPAYIPEPLWNDIGDGTEAITAFGRQYSFIILFKEHSLWSLSYSFGEKGIFEGMLSLPVRPVSSTCGCDVPDSVQNIDNLLVWCHSEKGVMMLTSTGVRDERNVRPVGGNICGTADKPGLLQEENLTSACSFDWNGDYGISVNGRVYLWHYSDGYSVSDEDRNRWFLLGGIRAGAFLPMGGRLCHFERGSGDAVCFTSERRDFGKGIPAHWEMAPTDFGMPYHLKTIRSVSLICRADSFSRIRAVFFTDRESYRRELPFVITSFSWDRFSWDTFSLDGYRYAKAVRLRPRMKKAIFFSVRFESDESGGDLAVSDLGIRYTVDRPVR